MKDWREALGMTLHPEGGAFREIYRSPDEVTPGDGRANRPSLTHIYFHLSPSEVSRFHRVASDEVWHLYEGEGFTLYQWEEGDSEVRRIYVGGEENPHCHIVPAGAWQAAEPVNGPVLVGCTVGPGFVFEDFCLIEKDSPVASAILKADPSLKKLL